MTKVVKKQKEVKSIQATLKRIKLDAAGIDLGSEELYVAVIDQPVEVFTTFTNGLRGLVNYLRSHGITSIAMEATGIYWFPVYEALDTEGFEVYVVNSRHAKNVPGRKTDVLDSEWLRELHTYVLLRSSFIPEANIRKLRYYMRLRKDHITSKASSIQHVQKNLDAMNVKLHTVISDIMGPSGQKVVRAIAAGENKPENLLALCSKGLKKRKSESILGSLEGIYKEEYLFALNQALEVYDFYIKKIHECDKKIEGVLQEMAAGKNEPKEPGKPKEINHNRPQIEDFHYLMMKLTNSKDATAIAGINDYTLLEVVSETGLDPGAKWPTSKHFTSWMGLAPPLNKSGKGKRPKKKFKRHVNNAGKIFKQIASNVGNGRHCALSGFYKRIKSRSGGAAANKATARKIAVYYYNLMTQGIDFVEDGIKKYEERYRQQRLSFLHKQARELGLELVVAP